MKLCSLLKEALDGGAQTTGYLGRQPAMQSVYNWGYKGYYTDEDPNLTAVADAESQNQLIDQAIDLMYSKFPDIIANKKLKRHMLQILIGQITQGELSDKVDMDSFIKRLKKTKGVETV